MEISVQREKVSKDGYLKSGRYMGVGAPLFAVFFEGSDGDSSFEWRRCASKAELLRILRKEFPRASVGGKPPLDNTPPRKESASMTLREWRDANGLLTDGFGEWLEENGLESVVPAACTHGCQVEPDGECEHGGVSVLRLAGVM